MKYVKNICSESLSKIAYRLLSCVATSLVILLLNTASVLAAGKGFGFGSVGTPTIQTDILNANCDVKFSSTKKLHEIVVEYDDGTSMNYKILFGMTYIIRGFFLDGATAVYVKSGNNVLQGKKNRGRGDPLPLSFFYDLDVCFSPDVNWGSCPCIGEDKGVQRVWSTLLGTNPQTALPNSILRSDSQSTISTRNNIIFTNGILKILDADGGTLGDNQTACVTGATTILYPTPNLTQAISDCRTGLYRLYGQPAPAVR